MSIIKFLDKASEEYYNGNKLISDEVFDNLSDKFNYNKVGHNVSRGVKHLHRLYSLQKYYEDSGEKPPIEGELTYSPKLDGAAISVLYVNGDLTLVITRGDGIEGVDITEKFLATKFIPHKISENGIVQINGEIASPKEIPNSRNYAAGSLNLKDIDEFRTRAISFFAYDYIGNVNHKTYDESMQYLTKLGFATVKDKDIHNIYPTDGIVIRINDLDKCRELGYTAKHPRFAYALKDRQNTVQSKILDVIWNTGRTGLVTPVAILEPVVIGDKTVGRATLNNPEFIEALDIEIGDYVDIRLAGMIIPEIVGKSDG